MEPTPEDLKKGGAGFAFSKVCEKNATSVLMDAARSKKSLKPVQKKIAKVRPQQQAIISQKTTAISSNISFSQKKSRPILDKAATKRLLAVHAEALADSKIAAKAEHCSIPKISNPVAPALIQQAAIPELKSQATDAVVCEMADSSESIPATVQTAQRHVAFSTEAPSVAAIPATESTPPPTRNRQLRRVVRILPVISLPRVTSDTRKVVLSQAARPRRNNRQTKRAKRANTTDASIQCDIAHQVKADPPAPNSDSNSNSNQQQRGPNASDSQNSQPSEPEGKVLQDSNSEPAAGPLLPEPTYHAAKSDEFKSEFEQSNSSDHPAQPVVDGHVGAGSPNTDGATNVIKDANEAIEIERTDGTGTAPALKRPEVATRTSEPKSEPSSEGRKRRRQTRYKRKVVLFKEWNEKRKQNMQHMRESRRLKQQQRVRGGMKPQSKPHVNEPVEPHVKIDPTGSDERSAEDSTDVGSAFVVQTVEVTFVTETSETKSVCSEGHVSIGSSSQPADVVTAMTETREISEVIAPEDGGKIAAGAVVASAAVQGSDGPGREISEVIASEDGSNIPAGAVVSSAAVEGPNGTVQGAEGSGDQDRMDEDEGSSEDSNNENRDNNGQNNGNKEGGGGNQGSREGGKRGDDKGEGGDDDRRRRRGEKKGEQARKRSRSRSRSQSRSRSSGSKARPSSRSRSPGSRNGKVNFVCAITGTARSYGIDLRYARQDRGYSHDRRSHRDVPQRRDRDQREFRHERSHRYDDSYNSRHERGHRYDDSYNSRRNYGDRSGASRPFREHSRPQGMDAAPIRKPYTPTTVLSKLLELRESSNLKAESGWAAFGAACRIATLNKLVTSMSNGNTYQIVDIDFAKGTDAEFHTQCYGEVSYRDYYFRKWGLLASNQDQPLLVAVPCLRQRSFTPQEIARKSVRLIPELCWFGKVHDFEKHKPQAIKPEAEASGKRSGKASAEVEAAIMMEMSTEGSGETSAAASAEGGRLSEAMRDAGEPWSGAPQKHVPEDDDVMRIIVTESRSMTVSESVSESAGVEVRGETSLAAVVLESPAPQGILST